MHYEKKKNRRDFIQVKGIGFTFLFDNKMKHNLINPTFLAFFKVEKQMYSLLDNNIEKLNTKAVYNNSLPFLPAYVDCISFEDTFHYVGKKVIKCRDNKFRRCKAVKFNFEFEGHPYSELFFIDNSFAEGCAILGSTFRSKFDI